MRGPGPEPPADHLAAAVRRTEQRMLKVGFDHVGSDSHALLAVDRTLRVVSASGAASLRFPHLRPIEGLPLTALFGPSGAADGAIGRAVIAAAPAVLFVACGEEEDVVRTEAMPLGNGHVILAIDAVTDAADHPYRNRLRALATLATGFRSVAGCEAAARIAERVVASALGVRASFVPLTGTRDGPSRLRTDDRRGKERWREALVVPDAVRAGDILAADDIPPANKNRPFDAELFGAKSAAASLWVPLVREGRSIAAMLVEADGPRRWTGEDVSLIASVLDATDMMRDRLAAMAATADAEERLRVLVNAAAAAVWEADPRGEVVVPSPTWCTLTGQSAAEMLGEGWIDALHPSDRERTHAAWTASTGSLRPFDVEVRLGGTGSPRWMNLKATPLRRDETTVTGWVGMAIDVSARKAAEGEWRAGEERLRTLLEGIPQLVWRAAPGSGWTSSSPQWSKTTGQTPAESLGNGWLDAVHPDDRAATMEAWHRATPAVPLNVDHRLLDIAAGRHRWFQTRATAVVDASGEVVEWLGTSTDIDDLRRLEEDERHFVAELQHRTRNLIAVVQSIVRQSLPRSASPEAFAAALERRLKSLSRVQGVLSRGPRVAITLGEIVRMELNASLDGTMQQRVTVEGPDVQLRRSAVQLLALALHELAENARMHGALSVEGGTLVVRWATAERQGGGIVTMTWAEHVQTSRHTTAQRAGYGLDLVENALTYSLGASVKVALEPDGLRCTISLPVADARASEAS